MGDFTDRSQFRVGDLLVVPRRLVVIRNEREIPLERRMMQVLVMLAENAGETLTKEQMLVEIWRSTIYGDSPVNKTVSILRERIGDDARKPRYIKTHSKVGYQMIAEVALPEDYRRMPSESWTGGNPYVGLPAFDAAHAAVYYGRSRIVGHLLKAMRAQIESQRRFVLIVGASGCGKTSLLHAGAIPLLTKPDGFDGLHALSVASCDLATLTAGDPLPPLIEALASWRTDRPVFPPQTTEQLRCMLTERPHSIAGFVEEAIRKKAISGPTDQPLAHLLLTIDHAEALVATTDVDTRALCAFARILDALCETPHVLVTMVARGDFYLKLMENLPALVDRKSGDGHLDVMAPREGEIAEIIRSPAWKADIGFETDPETRSRLDDVLRDAAISQPDALPLLQHTLHTLYDRRNEKKQLTFAAYNAIGGLDGAIGHRAEEVFGSLPLEAQESIGAVLARLILIQPDTDSISARRAFKDELTPNSRFLVDSFIAAHLFVGDSKDGRPTVGVAHEALLRRWPRAVDWLEDNRRLLQSKGRLRRGTDRWISEGRSADHLLNPGRQLIEAIEVESGLDGALDDDERDFIRASERLQIKKNRVKRAALSSLIALTLISFTMAWTAIEMKSKSDLYRNQAIDSIGYMLVELADELRPNASIQSLDSISAHAIRLLERKTTDDMDQDELINYSRSLRIRGEVLNAQRKDQESLLFFQRADRISKMSLDLSGRSEKALFEAGQTAFWLGQTTKDKNESIRHMTKYASISDELRSHDEHNPSYMMEQSFAINGFGVMKQKEGDCEEAIPFFLKSLRTKNQALLLNKKRTWEYERIVTESYINSCLSSQGLPHDANEGYSSNINSLRAIIEQRPDAVGWRWQLATILHFSAIASLDTGRQNDANDRISESIEILRILSTLQPKNIIWKRSLANALIKGSEISMYGGDKSLASNRIEEARSIIESQKKIGLPDNWIRIDFVSKFFFHMLNDRNEERMDEAVSSLRELASKEKTPSQSTSALAKTLILRGILFHKSGRHLDARNDWREATEALETRGKVQNYEMDSAWVIANQLLGERHDFSTKTEELRRNGYKHPLFEIPKEILANPY